MRLLPTAHAQFLNALGSVAWEDLHRYPNPFNAAAYLMQTLEPPRRPLTDLLAC